MRSDQHNWLSFCHDNETGKVRMWCGQNYGIRVIVFVPVIALVTCDTTSVDPLQILHRKLHFLLRSVQVQKHRQKYFSFFTCALFLITDQVSYRVFHKVTEIGNNGNIGITGFTREKNPATKDYPSVY